MFNFIYQMKSCICGLKAGIVCAALLLAGVAGRVHPVDARTLLELPKAYKESKFQFFPIPYFETDPGAGETYGLMPTFLWYDPDDNLITIAVAALTYNPKVTGWGGLGGLFFYPSDKEYFEIFAAGAQDFAREYYLHYLNENWARQKLDVDVEFQYLRDPFERFYGFGPAVPESNESNFVSRLWYWKGRTAYEVLPKFDLQLEEKWVRIGLNPRAISSLNDTAAFFAGNNEVAGSNQWTHRLSLIWDTRDSREFPKAGRHVEASGLFVPPGFDGNPFYSGYGLVGKEIFTLGERFTTVFRLTLEELFGDSIPFYMQTSLGGENDLRSFVKRRFTGRGRILFDVEERILVKSLTIMKAKFDLSLDPFFAVGQVFDRWGEIQFNNLQPVGGIGFRALVPPAVVGRVDFAFGAEGFNAYTTLNYPF